LGTIQPATEPAGTIAKKATLRGGKRGVPQNIRLGLGAGWEERYPGNKDLGE